jgi:cell wall-associated NlpC family hydrolase
MRPILRSTTAAVVVLATALFVTLGAAPTPAPGATLASKQAQAAQLDAQVQKLEGRYDDLQERYRGARYELDRIRREVAQAHRVVLATRKDLGVAKDRLADRAGAIYRTGGAQSDLAELAVAGSFQDFFARVDSMRRIGVQDASVLERVELLNAKVEAREKTLRTARARAAKATARAKRDKEQMQSILDERQAALDSVNSDIRAIMEQQRREAAARAAAAARETAALADTGEQSGGSSSSSGVSLPLPPGSSTAAQAASIAMGKIGTPYVWAASGPDSFDCSGLVMWAFAQAGRPGLPHSTYSLINMGVEVPLDQLQVGDLVFSASIGHMGIYVGNNSFVHAPRTGDVVKVTSLSDYSIARARRI